MANNSVALKLLNAFIWGFGRQIGNSVAKSTVNTKQNVVNPKSKFRKRVDNFDMGGNFVNATKNLTILIEMFHEEYVINKSTLPAFQIKKYLKSDADKIRAKIKIYMSFITNDAQMQEYDKIMNFWYFVVREIKQAHNL